MPHVFLIAGPNGAGKSTSAPRILSGPRRVDEFVNDRVAAGGHSIPEGVIRRRYVRGLVNLFGDYMEAVNSWQLMDNTSAPPARLIAMRYARTGVRIFDNRTWTTLAARYMKPRAEQQPAAVTEQELGWTAQDIVDAISEAVTEALRRHKARGESVVIWRDGKIVVLKPEEIDV